MSIEPTSDAENVISSNSVRILQLLLVQAGPEVTSPTQSLNNSHNSGQKIRVRIFSEIFVKVCRMSVWHFTSRVASGSYFLTTLYNSCLFEVAVLACPNLFPFSHLIFSDLLSPIDGWVVY